MRSLFGYGELYRHNYTYVVLPDVFNVDEHNEHKQGKHEASNESTALTTLLRIVKWMYKRTRVMKQWFDRLHKKHGGHCKCKHRNQ